MKINFKIAILFITLLIMLALLVAGFRPASYSVKITNDFPFPVTVFYGFIHGGKTAFYTSTEALFTLTRDADSTSTLLLVTLTHPATTFTAYPFTLPVRLNPGETGEIEFTDSMSCSRNDKDNVFLAQDEQGNIVYEGAFSYDDLKAMKYELEIPITSNSS